MFGCCPSAISSASGRVRSRPAAGCSPVGGVCGAAVGPEGALGPGAITGGAGEGVVTGEPGTPSGDTGCPTGGSEVGAGEPTGGPGVVSGGPGTWIGGVDVVPGAVGRGGNSGGRVPGSEGRVACACSAGDGRVWAPEARGRASSAAAVRKAIALMRACAPRSARARAGSAPPG